jgi:hypothetical protein
MSLILVATVPALPQAPTPTLSPAAGSYANSVVVTLTDTAPGAVIYYAINGTPTTSSPSVSSGGTITITTPGASVVNAFATATGYSPSAIASATYTVTSATQMSYPLTQASFVTGFANANTAAFQSAVARFDLYILMAYQGIEATYGTTLSTIMGNITSDAATNYPGHAPLGFDYQIENQWFISSGASGATDPVKINALTGNAGWLLQGTSGNILGDNPNQYRANDSGWAPTYTINTVGSVAGPSTVTGGPVNWAQWSAWYEVENCQKGNGAAMGAGSGALAANPHLAGISRDNQYLYNRDTAYWQYGQSTLYQASNQAGGSGSNSVLVRPEIAQGQASACAMTRAMSSLLIIGNSDAHEYYGDGTNPPTIDPVKIGLYDYVNCEAPVGQAYSIGGTDHGLSFQQLMLCLIQTIEPQCKNGPQGCIWNMEGRGNGTYGNWAEARQSGWSAADYQALRYQVASALLLNWIPGCPTAATATSGANNVFWFDEFDSGRNILHWLGTQTQGRPLNSSTGAYVAPNPIAQNCFNTYGIITILFGNAVIYLYPAGTSDTTTGLSAKTIPSGALYGGGGHHITYTVTPTGMQPPNGSGGFVSSGAAFSSLYIQPRDAIFTLYP